ncbi:redoxin domain-containing protein [Microbulbifer spongiae]|uniref:Redoxin domain-containing protein n=1 Tax=Microbulbifer spongiae TaxID=2944933 RepID=A0ABY9EFD7_9GAMM|nr:redoxin domain-containing protein [Microbulbifer sp. MI-G]WKD50957.1 redoxin domain-containing protein [Microbulbifer sp. MI-G]
MRNKKIEHYLSRLNMTDIEGNQINIGKGKKVWLSIFREANCPFCNMRVYEMTQHAQHFLKSDIQIVAVFKSSVSDTRKFIARQPRPFKIIADPEALIYQGLHLRSSFMAKLKAVILHMPRLLQGLSITGIRGLLTTSQLPADLLLSEEGKIVQSYTAKDISDHIPFSDVESFMKQRSVQGTASSPLMST